MAKRYWLMKSEEEVYSIRDLEGDGSTHWEGVRNYEARNLMRDQMKVGDGVLFYHSNAKPPGVAGVAEVARTGYPDNPRWFMVDVAFVEAFREVLRLEEIRATPELGEMALVKRARLSVQPVEKEAFQLIRKMGRKK